ncbi:MAG: Tol biopolymer transport system component [Roseivirga sp.]|jgi:Tol biopolymer transport system component
MTHSKAYLMAQVVALFQSHLKGYFSIFLIASMAVSLFSCQGGSTFPKFDQAIVYTSEKDNYNLYQIDELGQWETQLTFSEGQEWFPQWNESFSTIVYYSQEEGEQTNIKVLNRPELDSLGFTGISDFQFFPNGKSILFSLKEADGASQNYYMHDIGSESSIQLTEGNFVNEAVSISPDGKYLALASDRSGTAQLYSLQVDGKRMTQLTTGAIVGSSTSWSPDGTQIAFTMQNERAVVNEDIYIIDIDGTNLKQVTNTSYAEKEIAWSPDGKKIAFHATTVSDGDQIYTINLENNRFVKITSGDFYHAEPTWVKLKR